MINSIKGLLLTLVSTMNGLRSPVTRQYPEKGTLWKREEAPTRFRTGLWVSRP